MSPLEPGIIKRLTSRKFLLSVAAVVYAIVQAKPEYAAIATAVYVVVQGWIDKNAKEY